MELDLKGKTVLVTGSSRGIFDKPSNINITNPFTVFSVKEMEEELRPVAMFIILDFIWTRIKKNLKKRVLVIDEAWYFMKHQDSASFIHSMVKRARKYYLGITTITQDVEDFLHNDYGKAIVSNASIQFLMKQSTASIPVLAETFYLSEGERQLLVSADVGEGVFFAGQNHVALKVVASDEEHEVITTNPEEILRRQDEIKKLKKEKQQKLEAEKNKHKPSFLKKRKEKQEQQNKTAINNEIKVEQTSKNEEIKVTESNTKKENDNKKVEVSKKNNSNPKQYAGYYTIDDYSPPTE